MAHTEATLNNSSEKGRFVMNYINIDAEGLKQINIFIGLLDKEEALAKIDRVIEIGIKSGISSEFGLEEELGFLFDIKYLVASLPFPKRRRVSAE